MEGGQLNKVYKSPRLLKQRTFACSSQDVPGSACGDSCGQEGEQVVDGIGGEGQADRRHQARLVAVPSTGH